MKTARSKNKLWIAISAAIIILIAAMLFKPFYSRNEAVNPFDNGGNERNMIVVMSDMHLGADLNYAECKNNLGALEKLLRLIREEKNVKELVFAGDLIDEWFVPATINTYQGKDQADFVERVASANIGVFDAINGIIKDGKIKVTYVPGNHDLTVSAANIEKILPGINQARDNVLGLGTYSPPDYPKIAIEHGHRYNFFCAPDPLSNQNIAPGTILPPGYFFTRIAALHVVQGRPSPGDTTPTLTQNVSGGDSQDLLYRYWKLWKMTVDLFPIKDKFNKDIIVTNVNGFKGSYSVNDLVPYQSTPGGAMNVNLFKGIQDSWEMRQTLNNVPVHTAAARAIDMANSATETDNQAVLQYFKNPASDKRIVIFGHTHEPKIITSRNFQNKKSIYANSGTWIDHNPGKTTANFVVIDPQNGNIFSRTSVKLYNFENEVVTKMSEDSMRY